jgi:hypothetical protein
MIMFLLACFLIAFIIMLPAIHAVYKTLRYIHPTKEEGFYRNVASLSGHTEEDVRSWLATFGMRFGDPDYAWDFDAALLLAKEMNYDG